MTSRKLMPMLSLLAFFAAGASPTKDFKSELKTKLDDFAKKFDHERVRPNDEEVATVGELKNKFPDEIYSEGGLDLVYSYVQTANQVRDDEKHKKLDAQVGQEQIDAAKETLAQGLVHLSQATTNVGPVAGEEILLPSGRAPASVEHP